MSFLAPRALWLLGLLGPLVLLYVLKVRRRRVRVPSVWLWREVRRELEARTPWKRFVLQVPLVLQALALIAMALAAARPVTSGAMLASEHVAIVIDTSASMGATRGEGTRFDEACRIAHELVESLSPGADAMLLDAGRQARIAVTSERDRRRLHDAIDALHVRDVEGDLGAALALSGSRLAQLAGERRVYVITDGALARPVDVRVAVPVKVISVGEPTNNVAIVRVDVRSGTDNPHGREVVQAFLVVANAGDAARELYVTMKLRGTSDTLASRKLVVEPGERAPVVLTFEPSEGDRGSGLVFELSPHDALPADDVAYGVVPPGRALPVVLAAPSEPSPWLARVIEADPDAVLERAASPDALGSVPDDAMVVLERACPQAVPGGDVWVVAPPAGECFGVKVTETLERPRITSWDESDPRMRFIALDDVFLESAKTLVPESRRQELLRSEHGALMCDASTNRRMVTVTGFDVGDTDWPYKASFVVFARNLLDQARVHRAHAATSTVTTGDAVRVRVPLSVGDVEVESLDAPSEGPRRAEAKEGVLVFPEVNRSGLHRVAWVRPKAGSVLIAANLASADESDLRRSVEIAGGDAKASSGVKEAMAPREQAYLIALAALGFLLLDIWYFTRRPASDRRRAASRLGANP